MPSPQRDGHYPGVTAIDSYGGGGFRFADMSHRGSILCLPSGIWAWPPKHIDDVNAANLEKVIAEAEAIEFIIVGTGDDIVYFPDDLRQVLRDHAIIVEAMATAAAVRTWNVVVGENRPAAAALIATGRSPK